MYRFSVVDRQLFLGMPSAGSQLVFFVFCFLCFFVVFYRVGLVTWNGSEDHVSQALVPSAQLQWKSAGQ